jgi:hypothetical protein
VRKIPSLFRRELAPRGKESLIVNEITPGCEWVFESSDWIASRKWDGTAVLVKDGVLYARYDAKRGKTPPPGAIPCQEPDPITGHWPHWIKADRPEDVWIREAAIDPFPPDGTYEAIGPKINGNPERIDRHMLAEHGGYQYQFLRPMTFETIRISLMIAPWEGFVFRHKDGRMCKVKRKDYGLPWPLPDTVSESISA